MRTVIVLLLGLAAFATVNAQAGVRYGASCQDFNTTVCVGSPDGKRFENIGDCSSPFCHATYIVCSGEQPIVMPCGNETVWSQRNQTCINRPDGPGGCPALCGTYDPNVCLNMTDGYRLNNPMDCQEGGMPTSFIYCFRELPYVTECPDDSYWVEAINSCINPAGLPELIAPVIPGREDWDMPLLPVVLPEAPTAAPSARRNNNKRTRPVLTPGQAYSMFSFYIRGKDLTEVSDYIIENAVANATGANILAIEQLTYINRLGLLLRDFNMPFTSASVQQITQGLQGLLSTAYPGVYKREVKVRSVQGGVSTASITNSAQPVSAVVDIVNRDELQTAIDVQESLPNFDVLLSEALAMMNNTAEYLGVTDELAAYFQTELTTLDDSSMIINVTLLHTLGKTGNQLLESSVTEGDMAAALSHELGYDVVAVMTLDDSVAVPSGEAANAPAPSMIIPVQATPVTPTNAAFSHSLSGAVMAVVGAACLSAFML